MQWFEMAGLAVILVALLISVVVILMRWFRHRERLAMIRQGLIPDGGALQGGLPRGGKARRRRGLLLGGLSIALLGLLLLCAAFFVAAPSLMGAAAPAGLSSLGLVPLPGLLVAFMGVGLLIVYVWAQPTVDRRAAAGAEGASAPVDAELEPYEPEVEGTTLDAKAPADKPPDL
jgi:hypothetical protein